MRTSFKMFALAAALVTSASSVAMAQYPCIPGYVLYGGICQPVSPPGYSNPVSGAVQGEVSGAASGYAAGGPIGAVVGGALGAATGTITGTAGAISGATAPVPCALGYHWYNGYCYPNR